MTKSNEQFTSSERFTSSTAFPCLPLIIFSTIACGACTYLGMLSGILPRVLNALINSPPGLR